MKLILRQIIVDLYYLFSYCATFLLNKILNVNKRRIFITCNYGSGYLCNPKYICERINKNWPGVFEIILAIKKFDKNIPCYIKQVKFRGLVSWYYIATSKIIIDNCRGWKFYHKGGGQIYIQTWHAYLGPKNVEAAANNLSKDYIRNAKRDGKIADFMISNNSFYENYFREKFWFFGEVIKCGLPRNEYLIHKDNCRIKSIKNKLGINDRNKICLYVPTFRNNKTCNVYDINVFRCIANLSKRFGGNFIFAYRLHPNCKKCEIPPDLSKCLNLTGYPDVQELLEISDVLISDYSSVIEDFMLTEKPAFIYAVDINSYNNERGFAYSIFERPYDVCTNNDELETAIINYNEDNFYRKFNKFKSKFDIHEDGNGSEYIAQFVYKKTS